MIYNEYKHPGITDENIKIQYGMNDKELNKLIFTNYQKYALIMENKNIKKHWLLLNTIISWISNTFEKNFLIQYISMAFVRIWSEINFSGTSTDLSVGPIDFATSLTVKSVEVAPYYCITVFDGANYTGNFKTVIVSILPLFLE